MPSARVTRRQTAVARAVRRRAAIARARRCASASPAAAMWATDHNAPRHTPETRVEAPGVPARRAVARVAVGCVAPKYVLTDGVGRETAWAARVAGASGRADRAVGGVAGDAGRDRAGSAAVGGAWGSDRVGGDARLQGRGGCADGWVCVLWLDGRVADAPFAVEGAGRTLGRLGAARPGRGPAGEARGRGRARPEEPRYAGRRHVAEAGLLPWRWSRRIGWVAAGKFRCWVRGGG